MELTRPSELKALLERHGLQLARRFGQHFLVDRNHLEKILAAAALTPDDTVLEIGPGAGVLTRELAKHAGAVVSIELDRNLPAVLADVMAEFSNWRLIEADALKYDWSTLGATKVVANIPYNITSPLIVKMLEHRPVFSSITLLVQKEVADRAKATPDSGTYGSLSVFMQFYAAVSVPATVPRNAFFPPPKVESAILHLTPHATPPVDVPSPEAFFAVSRAAFGQRRKMLLGALSHGMDRPREEILAALNAARVTPDRRAETLSLDEIAAIACALQPLVPHGAASSPEG
nr:16S rRNA (adenine(1518)-N(6)/adenine(1519)-N(6))-dimethyltransferase RsmA [Armatimonas sp.]